MIYKKTPFSPFIAYIKKLRRKAYWTLPLPWWYVFLFLCSVMCFEGSILCKIHNLSWLSSLFQSLGAGIVTGIVVFILGNIRNQTKEYTDELVQQLSKLYKIQEQLYFSFPDIATIKLTRKKYNYIESLYTTINAALEYIEEIEKLDYYILLDFSHKTNVDLDNIKKKLFYIKENKISENLNYMNANTIYNEIINILDNTTEWFELKLKEAELQKQQLKKYPF